MTDVIGTAPRLPLIFTVIAANSPPSQGRQPAAVDIAEREALKRCCRG